MKNIFQKRLNSLFSRDTCFSMIALVQVTLMLIAPLHTVDAGIRSSVQKAMNNFANDDAGIGTDDMSQAGVQGKKQLIPEVEVVFTNTEGDLYTAVAQVTGVTNPSDAYYTWYLKNDTFDRTNKKPLPENPSGGTYEPSELIPGAEYMGDWEYQGKDCEDGEYRNEEVKTCKNWQMERYKIAATRAHIATKFDVARFDSEFNTPGGNGDFIVTNDEFPAVKGDFDNIGGVLADPAIEDDNDGAVALVGGSDNFNGRETISREGKLSTGGDTDNYCYVYDNTSGIPYELVQSDPRTGMFCDGEKITADNEDWSVECLQTEIFDTCEAQEQTSKTSLTTTTTPDETNSTSKKVLNSCERRQGDARCLFVPAPHSFVSPLSIPTCQNGGVPTCVPKIPTPDDAVDIDDVVGADADFEIHKSAELEQNIIASESCTDPSLYALIYLIDDIRNDIVLPVDPQTKDELLAEKQDELNLLVPGEDVSDDTVFQRLYDETLLPVDRNSFACTGQDARGKKDIYPEIMAEYNLVAPTCIGGGQNVPNKRDGKIFSEASGLVNTCTESIHLAPFPFTDDINDDDDLEDRPDINFTTGDGEFGRDEERFWGTNPENAITFSENVNDEEFILGKGLNEFTWEYQEGDELGVVVEARGTSSTKHDNQNPFVSFVFMKYGCEPKGIDSYTETIRKKQVQIDTTNMTRSDLNACLYQNFAKPGNVQENNNLNVEIDVPEGTVVNNQDFIIDFEATAGNESISVTDGEISDRSVYDWKISYSKGAQDPESQEIQWKRFLDYNMSQSEDEDTKRLFAKRMEMLGLTELKAIGLSDLRLKANFVVTEFEDGGAEESDEDNIFTEGLLRVTVEVNAPTKEAGVTVYGRAENIVSLISQERPQLNMYHVKAVDDPDAVPAVAVAPIDKIAFKDLAAICDSVGARYADAAAAAEDAESDELINRDKYEAEDIVCRVLRNEILAFAVPDESDIEPEHVAWEVNGERISCDTTLAPELCQRKPAMVFLPAIQKDGEIQSVTATSSDPAAGIAANETFSRSFVITAPKIVFEVDYETNEEGEITSTDDSIEAQTLGSYIPITGDENVDVIEEQSNSVFVRTKNEFKIKAKLDPSVLEDYATAATGPVSSSNDERVNVTWEWLGGPEEDDQGVSNLVETITVPEQLEDQPMTVKARVTVSTPQQIRQLLQDHFDVGQYDTSPLTAEGDAIVHEIGYSPYAYLDNEQYRAYVKGNEQRNKTFTATVFGNTASYFLFILKISLTIGIILFLSSFAMGGVSVTDRRRRL